jgi:hypothetical protein
MEKLIRVRHNTSVSAADAILEKRIIKAGARNRVYVEKAQPRAGSGGVVPGSARDKERELGLKRGRGSSGIDFDVEPDELKSGHNPRTRHIDWFVEGDVMLGKRNPEKIKRH